MSHYIKSHQFLTINITENVCLYICCYLYKKLAFGWQTLFRIWTSNYINEQQT